MIPPYRVSGWYIKGISVISNEMAKTEMIKLHFLSNATLLTNNIYTKFRHLGYIIDLVGD